MLFDYIQISLEHLGSILAYANTSIMWWLFLFISAAILVRIAIQDIKTKTIPHYLIWGLIYWTLLFLLIIPNTYVIAYYFTFINFIEALVLLILIHIFSRDGVKYYFKKIKWKEIDDNLNTKIDYLLIFIIFILTILFFFFGENLIADFIWITFIFFIILTLLAKGNFGIGDIELFIFISLVMWILSIPVLFLASILAIPYIIYVVIKGKKEKNKELAEPKSDAENINFIPFWPFIIASYYIALVVVNYWIVVPILNK